MEEKYHITIQVQGGDFERDFDYELFKILPTGERVLITLPTHTPYVAPVSHTPEKNNKKNQKQHKRKNEKEHAPVVETEEEPVFEELESVVPVKKNKKRHWDRRRKRKSFNEGEKSGEENFKVVQQETLTAHDAPAEEHKAIVKKEDSLNSTALVPMETQKTSDVIEAVFPEKKKGGWWNRLVK